MANVPDGVAFKGDRRFVVQDVEIRTQNTGYLLEPWRFPTGEYVTARCRRRGCGVVMTGRNS